MNSTEFWRVSTDIRQRLLQSGFEILGSGRSRFVYGRGNIVVKLPTFPEAQLENRKEREIYVKRNDPRYAACRLFNYDGIDFLVMERVDPFFNCEALPSWAKAIDNQQIGKTVDGRIVAFDYPDDPLYQQEPLRSHDELVRLAVEQKKQEDV